MDTSKYVDGKPVETPAYKTIALVINYVDPNDNDPALIDTSLEKVELFVKGSQTDAAATGLRELTFQRKETTETTSARYECTVELSPDDFDLGKDLEYLSQVIHLRIEAKGGQEITVYGGNDTPQARTLLSDGSYHVANYYESFGSANKPTVMKKDSFTVTITVTAKDGIHKDIYFITVNKSGRAALIIPTIYQNRELLIVPERPIRDVQLAFGAVSITDAEGLPINTARALEDGTLMIEFLNPEVASWDGKTRNGDNLTVSLLAQGKTDIKLTYDDGGLHLEGTAVLYVNYTVGMLADARSDAYELWADESRQYEEGAKEALLKVYRTGTEVYDKYKNKDRRLMDQTQFDEINDAVNDLRAAIDAFKHQEIGIKIVEFPGWPEAYDLPEDVDHEMRPKDFVPERIDVITAAGERLTLDVTWKCSPNYSDHDGQLSDMKYIFTLVLPAGYVPDEGVEFPSFVVNRKGKSFDNLLTPDNVWLPEAVDGGRGKRAIKTVETPATLRVYKGTTLEEILALTLETGAGEQQVALPTKWLTIPEDYDPDNVGGSYLFTLTAVAEQKFENRIWHWHEDFTEEKREFQIRVYIIDPPVVEVTGLPDDIGKITVAGKKIDSVLGKTVESNIEEFEITAANGWKKELVGAEWRGQRLCKTEYEFEPEPVDGYTSNVTQAEGRYTISYKPDTPQSIEWNTNVPLVLVNNGKKADLSIKDQPVNAAITWVSSNSDIVFVPNENSTETKATPKNPGTATITVTVKHGEQELSDTCSVIVLPETLAIDAPPLQAGSKAQLSFQYFDDVKDRTTWTPSDPNVASVDATGVVTALKAGSTTITATVETDNGPVSGTCTITVTPADPGDGGDGGTGDGSGNGGGALNGQAMSGGGDYRDLLTDPLSQQGTTGTTKPNTNTAQGTRQPQTGTSQATGQKPEASTDAAETGGSDDGADGSTVGRVIAVSRDDEDTASGSAGELAVILISCSVLLAAGLFRGKKRGGD